MKHVDMEAISWDYVVTAMEEGLGNWGMIYVSMSVLRYSLSEDFASGSKWFSFMCV